MEDIAVNGDTKHNIRARKGVNFPTWRIFLHGLVVEFSCAKEARGSRVLRELKTWQSGKSLDLRFSVVMCLNVW